MSGADDWHPVGSSHSVEAGSSAGTRLFDRELAVWRDIQGVVHVWEDRCPHRGMKLSFGFVRGDHIACLYHGWQYNRAGHCQYIPAHPDLDVPNTIKVPVYPAQECCGMIWTNLSPTPAPFDVAEDVTTPLRSLYFECDLQAAIAALGSVRLVPFASHGLVDTRVNQMAGKLYTLTSGNDRLLIGVQSVSGSRTALHIAISGSPTLYQGRGQCHFLAWALQLRRAIEQPRSALSSASSAAGRA
jgi:nitrite reductase/ring-hydroxylating ferredoxin subunit